ncbi:MAG: aminoglycoside phosphotransferase family protein [SAR324 cluster bacterium]|nr:aminoglycoside phosphotransferase family protein [SAR324 cluster bacterium]
MKPQYDLENIGSNFLIEGDFIKADPYSAGHINDTFAATYHHSGTHVRYIFQRINHEVFKDPVQLMENIKRVTEHQKNRLKQERIKDISRFSLTLLDSLEGVPHHRDTEGNFWRIYSFIENAQTFDIISSPQQAYQAARSFGTFQTMLLDLPGERLYETIPEFHNTAQRFQQLEHALAEDKCNRAKDCQKEIRFAEKNHKLVHVLLDMHMRGEISERITHNDTKLNNVLFDNFTGEGICVIDLDTVMPGLTLYDFGDLIRSSTSPSAEDEKDLSKVSVQINIFQALLAGYLETAGAFLNSVEKSNLVFSGKLIAFETFLRFLTDHINGDRYFKIHRTGQNLDRCRTQMKLVESIEQQEETMNHIVEKSILHYDF